MIESSERIELIATMTKSLDRSPSDIDGHRQQQHFLLASNRVLVDCTPTDVNGKCRDGT